jgi:hypothetical protein
MRRWTDKALAGLSTGILGLICYMWTNLEGQVEALRNGRVEILERLARIEEKIDAMRAGK